MTLFQRIRKKGKDQKGFTLGELLIVVAIIGVLVAISIPILTKQVYKARIAVTKSNLRSIYSELVADYIDDGEYEIQKISVVNEKPASAASGRGRKRRNTTYNYDLVVIHGDERKETFKIYNVVSRWSIGMTYNKLDSDCPPFIDVVFYPEPTGNKTERFLYGSR